MAGTNFATANNIFLADLARNLFANNSFLLQSRNWSAFTNANTVNWSQSGAVPRVIFNRDTQPHNTTSRIDIKRTYELSVAQTEKTPLVWEEEMVVNYNKRQDILSDHISVLDNDIALRVLHSWLDTAANTLVGRTSGANRPPTLSGATGQRNKLVLADLIKLTVAMDDNDIPDDGRRCLLIPAVMKGDLLEIQNVLDNAFINRYPLLDGALTQLFGLNIFVRSKTISYDDSGAAYVNPKIDDSYTYTAGGVDHCSTAIAWHPNFVTRAISRDSFVRIIEDHEGVTMSAKLLTGGAPFYQNAKGVYVLAEGYTAA